MQTHKSELHHSAAAGVCKCLLLLLLMMTMLMMMLMMMILILMIVFNIHVERGTLQLQEAVTEEKNMRLSAELKGFLFNLLSLGLFFKKRKKRKELRKASWKRHGSSCSSVSAFIESATD